MTGIKRIKYLTPEHDCSYNDTIVCPYCGHEEANPTEYLQGSGQGDDIEINCSSCDKEFIFSYGTKITFSSRCKDCDFELVATGEGYNYYECKRCGNSKCNKEL